MNATPTSTSRRRVVQGLAWAAPAVAMTAAAPAFAASCTPRIRVEGGPLADLGTINNTTIQQIAFGANVFVDNLPANTAVKEVREQWWIQNPSSDTSTGDGMWFMGNARTNWYQSAQCKDVGCSVPWTKPIGKATSVDYTTAPGKGWTKSVYNTGNIVSTVFPPSKDGTVSGGTFPAWDANLTWTPSDGPGITPGTRGCNNFNTGPSGKFGVNYTKAPIKSRTSVIRFLVKVTVTLSVGPALTYEEMAGIKVANAPV